MPVAARQSQSSLMALDLCFVQNNEVAQLQQTGGAGVYTPFGGGSRLCPGYELARVVISVFLHYLVTGFRYGRTYMARRRTPMASSPLRQALHGVYWVELPHACAVGRKQREIGWCSSRPRGRSRAIPSMSGAARRNDEDEQLQLRASSSSSSSSFHQCPAGSTCW